MGPGWWKKVLKKLTERGEVSKGARGDIWRCRVGAAALVLLLGIIYLSDLFPGVHEGDAAELQVMSPLLGICHPPGYQIEVTFGKLFSLLPIGDSAAWRLNFMMMICGIVGVLSLYGAVRRITGRVLPGIVAGLTLGFSIVFWVHSLVTEAYVFYATFLLLGVYTAVRFVQSDKSVWLYLTALSLGTTVADRPSELFVLPAFFALWFWARKKVRLGVVRIAVALALFVLPFAFSVGGVIARNDSTKLAHRDDTMRDVILGEAAVADPVIEIRRDFDPDDTATQKLAKAVQYCLGLNWARKATLSTGHLWSDTYKYTQMLTGSDVFAQKRNEMGLESLSRGLGTSVGALGIALVIAGTVIWRKQYGWVLLGWGLFVGNFAFILWHHTWDNMTFTIPGLVGLAMLAGFGAAGTPKTDGNGRAANVFRICCLVGPLFLFFGNYPLVKQTLERDQQLAAYGEFAKVSWPENSVFLYSYWRGMTIRYYVWVEGRRTDCHVIVANRSNWDKLATHLLTMNQPFFLPQDIVDSEKQEELRRWTPPNVRRLGLLWANPPAPASEGGSKRPSNKNRSSR
ncbi:MAG: protein O-mannosyl-transferase family [Planctomycetota bacterium]|jgi:hypothetical protein